MDDPNNLVQERYDRIYEEINSHLANLYALAQHHGGEEKIQKKWQRCDKFVHYFTDTYSKHFNLFSCGRYAKRRICQFGFDACVPLLLILLGRENRSRLECFIFNRDGNEYTMPCLLYLSRHFPEVTFTYTEGCTISTLSDLLRSESWIQNTFDLVLLDSSSDEVVLLSEVESAKSLLRKGGYLLVDPSMWIDMNPILEIPLSLHHFREVDILPTTTYPHRIFQPVHSNFEDTLARIFSPSYLSNTPPLTRNSVY